ncbi:MAG: hypothetical protein HY323_04815 [Betaproteobacteria bacterium]|nr:hypothetical protein [Betaproteobacteria bacterium]
MADKLLISVSANQATVGRWRGGRLFECLPFPNDDDGLSAYKDFLATAKPALAHIMVDAVEEDYRFETLPHSYGRDREEMVARKLKQHYRATPYFTAWLQGRESGKRRDDRYLFSALTNPDLVTPWLQPLIAAGCPIAGVYLLPMVSQALLDKLDFHAPNLLIISQHASGLRLTFFRDQQLRISRLTRGDVSTPQARMRFYVDEISNTRLYLHALRTMTLDEHLTVVMLDRDDTLANIAQSISRDNVNLDCVRLGREELASRIGLSAELFESTPDALYLFLLGLKAPASNLAPASVTAGYQRYRARRSIYAACGIIAFAGAAWTGVNVYQIVDLRAQAEDAARQTAQQVRLYQETTRQFPAAPASAENLKKAVEIAQKIRDTSRTPEAMMALVSRALEASPNIVVREFGWKFGTTEIDVEDSGSRSPAAEPPAGTGGRPRRQSGFLAGEVRPFRGDYRAAIDTINGFARRLAQHPAVAEVRVVRLPLNVNPTLTLSGNTTDTREQGGSAEFRLLLVYRPNA